MSSSVSPPMTESAIGTSCASSSLRRAVTVTSSIRESSAAATCCAATGELEPSTIAAVPTTIATDATFGALCVASARTVLTALALEPIDLLRPSESGASAAAVSPFDPLMLMTAGNKVGLVAVTLWFGCGHKAVTAARGRCFGSAGTVHGARPPAPRRARPCSATCGTGSPGYPAEIFRLPRLWPQGGTAAWSPHD